MNTQEDPVDQLDQNGEEQSKHGWSILIDDKVYRSDDPDIIRLDDPDADDKLQKIISNTEAFKKLKDVSERLKRLNEIKMKMNPNESPTIERLADTVQRITDRIEDLDPETLQAEPDILEAIAREECKKANSYIRQGTATNELAKLAKVRIDPTKNRTIKIDTDDETITITRENFSLTIPSELIDFKAPKRKPELKTSMLQLLDIITLYFTESGAKSPSVTISLKEYMERRGLKDRKEAKAQAIADMKILKGTTLSWEEKEKGGTVSYAFINLSDRGEVKRNGDIFIKFGETFYGVLLKYTVMYYPPQLSRLNSNRSPYSFPLLRRISVHKNMNVGKSNEDTIAVKTLLEACGSIPSYEDVMETDRALTRRIIDPFKRDMNELAETLSWEFRHKNGTPLTDRELDSLDYETFVRLNIHTTWTYYPDQTARRERKEKAMEQALKKKEGSRKKGGEVNSKLGGSKQQIGG